MHTNADNLRKEIIESEWDLPPRISNRFPLDKINEFKVYLKFIPSKYQAVLARRYLRTHRIQDDGLCDILVSFLVSVYDPDNDNILENNYYILKNLRELRENKYCSNQWFSEQIDKIISKEIPVACDEIFFGGGAEFVDFCRELGKLGYDGNTISIEQVSKLKKLVKKMKEDNRPRF